GPAGGAATVAVAWGGGREEGFAAAASCFGAGGVFGVTAVRGDAASGREGGSATSGGAAARASDIPMPASGITAVAIRAVVHSPWRVAAFSESVRVASRTSPARTPPRRTPPRIARSPTPTIASTTTAVLWPCRAARATGRAPHHRRLRTPAGSAP